MIFSGIVIIKEIKKKHVPGKLLRGMKIHMEFLRDYLKKK